MKSDKKKQLNLKLSKKIGKKIRLARERAHLTQKELAHYLEISDKAVSAYEVGRSLPSIDILQEISRLTYKPMSYFHGEESDDIDVQLRLKIVEKELLEIKKLLQKKK